MANKCKPAAENDEFILTAMQFGKNERKLSKGIESGVHAEIRQYLPLEFVTGKPIKAYPGGAREIIEDESVK